MTNLKRLIQLIEIFSRVLKSDKFRRGFFTLEAVGAGNMLLALLSSRRHYRNKTNYFLVLKNSIKSARP